MKKSKICSRCKKKKNVSEFYRDAKGDVYYWCIKCMTARAKKWGETKRGRAYLRNYLHNWWLKRTYGIDSKQYDKLLKKQNGACAICKQPEVKIDTRTGTLCYLAVDHNAKTKQVRGLLCYQCNSRLLGSLKNKDAVVVLKNAVKYLQKAVKQYQK